MTAYLTVEPRGWPVPLITEVLNAHLQAHLPPHLPSNIQAEKINANWPHNLPREEAVVFVLLTRSLDPGWQTAVSLWLEGKHTLYVLYIDSVDPPDVRALADLTSHQPVARAPFRIV